MEIGDRNKNLSIEEDPNKIKSYLKDTIINLQKCDTWKIQLTVAINFISSKNTNKEQTMHSKSDNIEAMTYENLDETIRQLFDSFVSRNEIGLETQIRGSDLWLW